MAKLRIGDKIKYKRHYDSISFTESGHTHKQGFEIVDAVYLGRAGKGKYKEFQGSEICVKQIKTGWIVGIDKDQILTIVQLDTTPSRRGRYEQKNR